jgi:hypothetical protein
MTLYRGSRKHVLDWVEDANFLAEFRALLAPSGAEPQAGTWLPRDYSSPQEARLGTYGPRFLPGATDWEAVEYWWREFTAAGNTPNWDLAAVCHFGGTAGLALVEAKANVSELKTDGKILADGASAHSRRNHKRIAEAIAEARNGLSALVPGVHIDRDSHYQLANRLAFSWKLASLGMPVVLVYLGFTGDSGIVDAGDPFRDDVHWREVFVGHSAGVVPVELFERKLEIEGTPLWVLVRSRGVLAPSPRAGAA